jgi:hypothetical protein
MSFKILNNNERILLITQHYILPSLLYYMSSYSQCLNLNPSSGRISQSVFNILIQPTEKSKFSEKDKWTLPINEPRAIGLRFRLYLRSRLSWTFICRIIIWMWDMRRCFYFTRSVIHDLKKFCMYIKSIVFDEFNCTCQ